MPFSPITDLMNWRLKSRREGIERMASMPFDMQKKVFRELMTALSHTAYGQSFGVTGNITYADYCAQVPLVNYESLLPWVERTMKGEQGLLWPGDIKWFAKSSGTTGTKSKFIPMSRESLEECHIAAGVDLVAVYFSQVQSSRLLDGLSLKLGGSSRLNNLKDGSYYGDLSAIMMQNLPFWANWRSTPPLDIALMDEWEAKLEKMAQHVVKEDVTSLFGVPSWMLVLMQRVLEITGAERLDEVWPHLELFVHGGVSYAPYKDPFADILPQSGINLMETYNASEGFFAMQDQLGEEGMLLMLNQGIFYEFIPMKEFKGRHSTCIPLEEVKLGVTYALVISTNGGLWRYILGDSIRFVSLAPYRLVLVGRTRLFINTFGEELMIDNAEQAMAIACKATGARLVDYSAAPVFMSQSDQGAHQWLIEFRQAPSNLDSFKLSLDQALKSLNSDYEAKRYKDMVLKAPVITVARAGCFHDWLKSKGKLGGQNKVPRLSQNRDLMDALLAFA